MMIDEESSVVDRNPWNKLNDVMVEMILVLLPVVDIFTHCQFVCKRWSTIIKSPTFSLVLHQALNRRPWVFIFDIVSSSYVVYDMVGFDWQRPSFQLSVLSDDARKPCHPFVTSSGLMCFFRSGTGSLIVCNPFTGSERTLPRWCSPDNTDCIRGMAIHVSGSNYQVFVVYGRWPNLGMKVFSSEENKASWTELPLRDHKNEYKSLSILQREMINNDIDLVGMKGVTIMSDEGHVMVYYLIARGKIVCFDTRKCTIFVYPRLLEQEHISADLVECRGRIFLVILMEVVESSATRRTLCVWEFDNRKEEWKHVSAMPSNMSQDYDIEAYVNCSGHGDYIMVCVNSIHENYFNQVVIYNIRKNTWVDFLPRFGDDNYLKILYAYCLKPSIKSEV